MRIQKFQCNCTKYKESGICEHLLNDLIGKAEATRSSSKSLNTKSIIKDRTPKQLKRFLEHYLIRDKKAAYYFKLQFIHHAVEIGDLALEYRNIIQRLTRSIGQKKLAYGLGESIDFFKDLIRQQSDMWSQAEFEASTVLFLESIAKLSDLFIDNESSYGDVYKRFHLQYQAQFNELASPPMKEKLYSMLWQFVMLHDYPTKVFDQNLYLLLGNWSDFSPHTQTNQLLLSKLSAIKSREAIFLQCKFLLAIENYDRLLKFANSNIRESWFVEFLIQWSWTESDKSVFLTELIGANYTPCVYPIAKYLLLNKSEFTDSLDLWKMVCRTSDALDFLTVAEKHEPAFIQSLASTIDTRSDLSPDVIVFILSYGNRTDAALKYIVENNAVKPLLNWIDCLAENDYLQTELTLIHLLKNYLNNHLGSKSAKYMDWVMNKLISKNQDKLKRSVQKLIKSTYQDRISLQQMTAT